MKRGLGVALVMGGLTACFDFDGAYGSYCARAGCDPVGGGQGGAIIVGGGAGGGRAGGTAGGAGGSTGGGATGGGTTAGGTVGGGSTGGGAAGGASGGTTAGGTTAGGSTAGGSGGGDLGGGSGGGSTTGGGAGGGAAGGSAGGGGVVDAGIVCATQGFCIYRQTQRTDFKVADGVIGTTLDNGVGFFSRFGTTPGTLWTTHGNDPAPSPGTARTFAGAGTGITPPLDFKGGSPFDFLFISEGNMTNARLRRVIDGGVPVTRYSGGMSSSPCPSQLVNAFHRFGETVVIGGYNDSLCQVNLANGAATLLQADTMTPSNTFVTDVYASPDGGIVFWATDDGYIGRLGQGRVTQQIDPDGVIAIDALDEDEIWALSDQGIVLKTGDAGLFQQVTQLPARAYSLEVTPDGVFIGMFGGIAYRTRFTDGGFEMFQLPVDPIHRVYGLSGGAGALHAIGDEGSINSTTSGFFFTLIPQNQ